MKAVAAVAEILKREGVEYLFCFPVNALIEECAKIDIRPIVARTERTLINMADGYSRASNGRKIGVATVQHGPGAENAYAGVAQAFADGSPLLFLPGGNVLARSDTPPYYDAALGYRTVAKWSAQINAPARVPEMMRRAFTLLRSGRRAPVVVELPTDVGNQEIPDFQYTPPKLQRSAANPDDVREAVRILSNAKRPVLHVGQGVLWSGACDELREFAELVSAPVMTTLCGKSAFPENHPLALGSAGYSGTKMVDHFLREADVILGIGCSFTSTIFGAPIPTGKAIVHITNNEVDLNKDLVADCAILGDAKLALRQLIDEIRARQPSPLPPSPTGRGDGGEGFGTAVANEIQSIKSSWLAEWTPKLTSDETPINPYRVIHELMRSVDRTRTIITHDSGTPRDQLTPFWETLVPRGYLGWGKSTQLGSSLGFAMGAKLAQPDKLVIQFLGDTAFGMCGMDFETAVRERIPILTVLLNNGLMGGYEKFIPIASEKYRSRFLTGDYTTIATGLGVDAQRVTAPSDIGPALQRAITVTEAGRPALVEFVTREETMLSKYW